MESVRMRVRLSGMMFLQYSIIAAWAVPLATYLLASPDKGGLGFTPSQTSLIYSATAFVGLGAPLILGLLADRLFATQRLLMVLHAVGAVVLFGAGQYCSSQQAVIRSASDPVAASAETFSVLLPLMIANAFVVIVTIALSNVTGLRNLSEPKKSFASVRLYGTVSWIVVNLAIDLLGDPISAQPLYVSSALSAAMSLYSLTLPHTPPAKMGKGIANAFGLPALKMFRDPGFRIVIVSALCLAAVQQFYTVYANLFLIDIGSRNSMSLQTIAQVSEILCMIAFPFAISRFGIKATMSLGVLGWVVRNVVFATCSLWLISVIGLPLHGMCYTFFFVVANVYVDKHAPPHLRASAQGIFMFTSAGVGTLLGNFCSAKVLELHHSDGAIPWIWFWTVPAVVAALVFVVFAGFFHDVDPPKEDTATIP